MIYTLVVYVVYFFGPPCRSKSRRLISGRSLFHLNKPV